MKFENWNLISTQSLSRVDEPIKLLRNPQTGMPNGHALVYFRDLDSAELARGTGNNIFYQTFFTHGRGWNKMRYYTDLFPSSS